MRQWKSITNSDYIIDKRRREDILAQIRKLAASYVPEWQFDEENPDIGSVLALLYTDEMEENIRRYNTLLERDYIELINMLGISLKPAFPAHSIVLLQLAQNTVPGFKLKKGIKLLGGEEDEENLVFETAHSLYVTESRLKTAFMASGKNGKVIPLLGEFPPIDYVDPANVVKESTAEEEEAEAVNGLSEAGDFSDFGENGAELSSMVSAYPFALCDFTQNGYGRYGVLFYHPYLFDVCDNDIIMRIGDAPELVKEIAEGKYQLSYYGDNGFTRITDLRAEEEEYIIFRKSEKCRKIAEKGVQYSLLLLEPVTIPEKNVMVSQIGFSSAGQEQKPQLIWNGTSELDVERFQPFGETIGLYDELYIGHDEYFSKPDAQITLRFQLDFDTHLVSLPRQQQEAELKVIKKKPKRDVMGAPAEIFADEISIEYYNGIGWRKLATEGPVQQIFAADRSGRYEIRFSCPKDFKPLETGGYNGRSIRIQVTRADNCYYQPALHHYPVIRNMRISYSYQDRFEKASKLVGYQGSKKRELSAIMAENPMTPIFSMSSYQDSALYLGFHKRMEDGPVSIFVQIQEMEERPKGRLLFSYSTREGFSRLKLSDHTDGLSHTGTLMFMPPTDMAKQTLEGQEAYWIKITDEHGYLEKHPRQQPVICDIQVNGVEVDNIDTMAEEEYYIDAFGPNMKFALNAQNILSIELWVNEMGLFSETEMKRMLIEEPERTKAEYSFLGEIEEFYVKWQEVDNFDRSAAGDRHYVVDRMNSRLHFGDGVHVQIPRNTKGVAFKVIMKRCDGEIANIESGRIGNTLGALLFVDKIYNPVQAYGGMNMESVDEALRRGTTTLCARNRLVSAQDYEREALNFSRQIAQAKLIVGRKKDGSFADGAISMVLLMQDYQDGEYSFLHMKQRLREHLLEKCELSVSGRELEIVEPIFVAVSVEAWVQVIHTADSFEIQQELCRILEQYLDPLRNNGWEIGRMVKTAQVELRLHMEKGKALLHRLMVTAKYADENGWHETDIEKLTGNPYVLVVSGRHKIHFEQNN